MIIGGMAVGLPPAADLKGVPTTSSEHKRQRGKVKRSALWMTSFSVIWFRPFLSSF